MVERTTSEPDDRGLNTADRHVVEWKPSAAVAIVWTILGTLLVFVGIFLFGFLYVALLPGDLTGEFTINLLVVIVGAALVMVLHEGMHALPAYLFGGRPTFGAALLHKFLPVLYCTVHGFTFTRQQFLVIALAPLVSISLAGVVAMWLASPGFWIVAALAVNFGGAVGDLWMTWLVLRAPAGTLVEDRKDGLRFHYQRRP